MFKRFMEPIEGIKKCLINVGSEIDFTAKCICIIFTIRRDVKTGIGDSKKWNEYYILNLIKRELSF